MHLLVLSRQDPTGAHLRCPALRSVFLPRGVRRIASAVSGARAERDGQSRVFALAARRYR